MKLKQLADYIFETESYTALNYDKIEAMNAAKYDGWADFKGGCTCAIKTTDDGQTIAGRNMDLTISNKPAYVVRTACPGSYKTVGLSYFYAAGPDYDEVLKSNGELGEFAEALPFLCEDIMNEEGLYIETNMRSGENLEDGRSRFGCSGTNPGRHRVCSTTLPRYVAEKCATVEEAIALVRELDIYTPSQELPWNFTFILGDSAGHYGLLEIAENKVSWLPGEQIQANFYLTPEFAAVEELKCGLGRYDVVKAGIDAVQNEDDFFRLIDKVTYFQLYRENPQYDVRSEMVGIEPHWNIDYVMDEANRAEIQARIDRNIAKVSKMSRQELQDAALYWESVFTVVANCQNRSLRVRFFEDNERILTLSV